MRLSGSSEVEKRKMKDPTSTPGASRGNVEQLAHGAA